jgi:hypothetical protein
MKGYVHNGAHLEDSIIEGYATKEIIMCCVDYFKDGKPIGVPVSWYHGRLSRKGTKGPKSFIDATYKRVRETHFSSMLLMAKFGKSGKTRLSSLGNWSIRFWQIQSWIEEEGNMRKFEDSSVFEAWKREKASRDQDRRNLSLKMKS